MNFVKPFTFFGLFFFVFFSAYSQSFYRWGKDNRLSVVAGIGINNYYGDLNDTHHFDPTNFNISLGIQYPLTRRIDLRASTMFYKIKAADSDSESAYRRKRNLSFRGRNFEFAVTSILHLFPEHLHNRKQIKFNPFFLAGIGFTYFNPEASYQGKWYKLRPIQTEGVAYKQIAPVIPIGIGLKFNINRDMAIIMECAYRFTTSDYLDDVSTQYTERSDSRDPIAAILSDRRPEVGVPLANPGVPRGNPETNDGYLTLNVKCAFKIGSPKPQRMQRENFMY